MKYETMRKDKILNIIDDLLQDCYNDVFEYENIEEKEAKTIYNNVKLYTIKLKEKIKEEA